MTFRRILRTAFIGGELDPLLEGRIDTEQHALGLSVCENFVPINEGPLIKRQGFEYVAPAPATASWSNGARRSCGSTPMLSRWRVRRASLLN